MAVTFEQARAVVDRELRPTWPAEMGTFMVADHGYEDDEDYLVLAGAREHLIDHDFGFMPLDAPALFVSKTTGVLTPTRVLDVLDRPARMRPVTTGGGRPR